MLLIVTSPDDVHADAVEVELRRRGAAYLRLDPKSFPTRASIEVEHGARASRYAITIDRATHELAEGDAGWLRRPTIPAPPPQRAAWLDDYARKECERLVHDLWNALPIAWLPGPLAAIRRADSKHLQLAVARAVGFTVPDTLVTTDPAAMLRFYREHDGRIIDKQPSTLLACEKGDDFIRYTRVVSPRDLVHAARLRASPMLFQAYVDKKSELRVTVIGERVFAAEIGSQATEHTRHDWRRYDLEHTPHTPHALPAPIERACVALVRALGLVYGAIDLVLTPTGDYVFLEINPNGQYLWLEHLTGLPITAALVDHLIGRQS